MQSGAVRKPGLRRKKERDEKLAPLFVRGAKNDIPIYLASSYVELTFEAEAPSALVRE